MKRSIVEVQESPRYRSFCLRAIGVCHPPSKWVCSQAWKLSELLVYFYGGFIFWHDRSLTPFLALLPLKWIGSRAENSKLFLMAWLSQWPAVIQEPSRSSPRVASLEQMTLLPPRKLQGFQELSFRNQGQSPNSITKDIFSPLITSEIPRLLGVLCQ